MTNRRELARELRDQGLLLREIAERFGVAYGTVLRWVNPVSAERARAYARAWVAANPERKRAYNRAYAQRQKQECPWCGGPMSRPSTRCRECRLRATGERRHRIAELWRDGLTVREIAYALDSTPNSVRAQMRRMRRDGWDLPYRNARTVIAHDR